MTRKVLIVYPILHHYRRGVFRALDNDPRLKVTYASAIGGHDGIAGMDVKEISRHVALVTHRLGRLRWQSGLVSHLIRSRYDDVVFLGDPSFLSTWLGAGVARIRGFGVYFWTIGWHRPESGAKRLLRVTFYLLADVLMLYGSTAVTIGRLMGYPARRMRVIGNSVASPSKFGERGGLALPEREEGDVWLGAVVRLNAVKKLDLLVRAAAILRQQGTNTSVLIVGEGPMRSSLIALAKQLEVPLHLPGGAYDESALSSFYERVSITVVPSAVGLTAIQSLNAGVPVISDDSIYEQMPEWESIVQGVTGATYAAGDVQALVEAIRRVLSLIARNRDEVSLACRAEVAKRWSADAHAQRIIKVLEEHDR